MQVETGLGIFGNSWTILDVRHCRLVLCFGKCSYYTKLKFNLKLTLYDRTDSLWSSIKIPTSIFGNVRTWFAHTKRDMIRVTVFGVFFFFFFNQDGIHIG